MLDLYTSPFNPAMVPLAAGCTLAALGAMAFAARRRAADAHPWWPLMAALGALALAAWIETIVRLDWAPRVGNALRVLLAAGGLAALIELGERASTPRCAWRLPRWAHAAVAAVIAAALLPRATAYADLASRLLLAYQGGALAVGWLRSPAPQRETARRSTRFIVPALIVYLVANSIGLGLFALPSILVAAAAAWIDTAAHLALPARTRPLIVWGAPLAFLVVVGLAGVALTYGADSPSPSLAAMLDDASGEDSASGAQALLEPKPPLHGWSRHASQIALAVVPIGLLIGAIWGLSRLPFAH